MAKTVWGLPNALNSAVSNAFSLTNISTSLILSSLVVVLEIAVPVLVGGDCEIDMNRVSLGILEDCLIVIMLMKWSNEFWLSFSIG